MTDNSRLQETLKTAERWVRKHPPGSQPYRTALATLRYWSDKGVYNPTSQDIHQILVRSRK